MSFVIMKAFDKKVPYETEENMIKWKENIRENEFSSSIK